MTAETERGQEPQPDNRPVRDEGTGAPPISSLAKFWARVREHKVVQWMLAYAAAAYALLHSAEMVSVAFEWPHMVVRLTLLLLILAFPIAVTLAWYHGHRAKDRISGPELGIITVLLVIAGSALWFTARQGHERIPSKPVADVAVPTPSSSAAVGSPPERSVAVLPFVDMSETKDQEYFSDGLSEELIDLLARVPELHVPARTSSFYFKGKSEDIAAIAQRLHVANLLEGSVRKAGNTLRVTVQLIRADSGYHVWSNSYDRDLKDVFKIQDDIAAEVVAALKLRLAPRAQSAGRHHTDSTDAYDQYLLGRAFYDRGTSDGLERATAAFRKAIALDGAFSAAYAGLALAEYGRADDIGDAPGFERATAAAEKAVALAPGEADGYAARAFLRYVLRWDWGGAEADFERALAIKPADGAIVSDYSELLWARGRRPEAIAYAKQATELDPLSATAWLVLAKHLTDSGDLASAEKALARSLEINPESEYSLMAREKLDLLEGKPTEALAVARRSRNLTVRLLGVATAEHSLGHSKESQAALEEMIETRLQDPYQVAEVYAWRGDKNKAFEWLERAYRQRDGGLSHYYRTDPLLSSLRSDPRYEALLRKMNL